MFSPGICWSGLRVNRSGSLANIPRMDLKQPNCSRRRAPLEPQPGCAVFSDVFAAPDAEPTSPCRDRLRIEPARQISPLLNGHHLTSCRILCGGVTPITALTGAAPHSVGCVVGLCGAEPLAAGLGKERQAARRPRRHCEVRFDSALGLRLAADLGLELDANQDDAAATIGGRRRQVHHLFPDKVRDGRALASATQPKRLFSALST